LGEQPALTGQLQPARAGLARQPGNELLIHRNQALSRGRRRLIAQDLVQVQNLLGQISHRVHTP
jgi:hypothetical protein